jgi:hypothetical protein
LVAVTPAGRPGVDGYLSVEVEADGVAA